MLRPSLVRSAIYSAAAIGCLIAGCSDDDGAGSEAGNIGGAAGFAGLAGSAGAAGSSGSAGQSGGAGKAGAAGNVSVGGASGGAGTSHQAGSAGTAGAAGAAGSAGSPPSCALTDSGPVEATQDGQIIENLRITSSSGTALKVAGRSNVIIRNVEVRHAGGTGIDVSDSPNTTIESVSVEHTGAPASGANSDSNLNNIACYASPGITIKNTRVTRGSSGVYLHLCQDSVLQFLEGHDFRGPFPRGQLVQWNESHNGLLEDFSVENPTGSWPEDNVNVYKSTGLTIRRGLVDGNNCPSGVGVIFDGDTSTGLVEDVDAIRMGNGCFSNYAGAEGNVFRRTRCRENICEDQGRGKPGSNALMWAGKPGLSKLRIEQSEYFASCNGNLLWPQESFEVAELEQKDFTLRLPIRVQFCWE